jgi:hypothetical protein
MDTKFDNLNGFLVKASGRFCPTCIDKSEDYPRDGKYHSMVFGHLHSLNSVRKCEKCHKKWMV